MFGLSANTILRMHAVLAKHPSVEKVILYGSRAKGNYKPGSDIDITFCGEHLTLSTLQQIETALDDLLLPYKIDASLMLHINNNELLEHIERVGRTFYPIEQINP